MRSRESAPDQGSMEGVKTHIEETLGHERVFLHESAGVLFAIGLENDHRRPDPVETSTSENDDSILRCLLQTSIVLSARSLILL